jgi:prevent-host-death family protein
MERLTTSKARDEFADTLNRVAYRGERIILHRRGRDLAALVPIQDLKALQELEDRRDVEEADRRLSDPAEVPMPYEEARRVLELSD